MTTNLEQKSGPEHISQHLQDLINTANNSIQTFKEQILEIYETAKKEGFTPQEARILIEEKVIKVSDRHLRRILPDEAKNQNMVREHEIADIGPQKPAFVDVKEADTTIQQEQEHDLPEPTQELPDDDFDQSQDVIYDKDLVDRYVKEIARLEEENTRLRIQKVGTYGNKFDFDYDYEMPSGDIVPFIVTVFPDKKTGYIRLNKTKIEETKKKEAKRR